MFKRRQKKTTICDKERRDAIKPPPGYIRMGDFNGQDIFVVGYPKSGNTWMQVLLSSALYGIIPEYAPEALTQELCPDIHYRRFFKRFSRHQFFKSHSLPDPLYRRVIYLVRDGRDVMVSYRHYLEKAHGRGVSWDEMMTDARLLNFGTWGDHVSAWQNNPYGAETIFVRYEDLLCNGVEELSRILHFASVNRSPEFIRNVLTNSSFEIMRKREAQFGMDHSFLRNDNSHFFRRGIIGSYQDEFPKRYLQEFSRASDVQLRLFGYV